MCVSEGLGAKIAKGQIHTLYYRALSALHIGTPGCRDRPVLTEYGVYTTNNAPFLARIAPQDDSSNGFEYIVSNTA